MYGPVPDVLDCPGHNEGEPIQILGRVGLAVSWIAWFWPFIFRAPHNQKRPSITAIVPTRVGLLLETGVICMAFTFRLPPDSPPGLARELPSLILGPIAVVHSWKSVTHLGKQLSPTAAVSPRPSECRHALQPSAHRSCRSEPVFPTDSDTDVWSY